MNMKWNIILLPIVFLILFSVVLFCFWQKVDNTSSVAILSVLAGGLVGVVGTSAGNILECYKTEKESEDRLKNYASSQAIELVRLQYDLYVKCGHTTVLAPMDAYQKIYKALFMLYENRDWPNEIKESNLIKDILTLPDNKKES